jgi:hypothetical protein
MATSSFSSVAGSFRKGYHQRVSLHFGHSQLFWECGIEALCQTYPTCQGDCLDGKASTLKSPSPVSSTLKSASLVLFQDTPAPTTPSLLYEYWRKLVQMCSKCLLTNEEDKLIAISGIATEFHRRLGMQNDYMAVLWSGDLACELTWSMSDCYGVHPREYRTHTWSWASVDGPVSLSPNTTISVFIRLLDFGIETLPESPFGQVQRGYIRLRGPL